MQLTYHDLKQKRKQEIIEGSHFWTTYKIYGIILEGRLREEANRLKILPETQAGFRKGRSCIDNIYALKTAAEKVLVKKKGKLYVFCADVKAAFDKVDKELLEEYEKTRYL